MPPSSLDSNRGIALNAGDGTVDTDFGTTLTYGGIMAGTGDLTKDGTGTLTLSGVNTYTGSTTIDGGTLSISADSGLGAAPGAATAGHLSFDGGTLNTSATFSLDSNRGIALNAGGGTIETDAATTLTYGGIMAGTGSFDKTGTGTLVLGGVNTYTGTTTVQAGTLEVTDPERPGRHRQWDCSPVRSDPRSIYHSREHVRGAVDHQWHRSGRRRRPVLDRYRI